MGIDASAPCAWSLAKPRLKRRFNWSIGWQFMNTFLYSMAVRGCRWLFCHVVVGVVILCVLCVLRKKKRKKKPCALDTSETVIIGTLRNILYVQRKQYILRRNTNTFQSIMCLCRWSIVIHYDEAEFWILIFSDLSLSKTSTFEVVF